MLKRFTFGSLLMTVIFTGLMAGFFSAYSFNVNYATLNLTSAEYAKIQSLFNQNVRHTGFFTLFFGSGVLLMLSTLLHLPKWNQITFITLLVATLLYIAVIIVYTRVHVLPINFYTESWDLLAIPADWAETRDAWNRANLYRSIASIIVFIMSLLVFSLNVGKN